MRNRTKHLLAIVCAGITSTALAQSAIDNLAKIEEETLILKAREKQLAIKAQIAAKEAELATKNLDASRFQQSPEDAPVILSIEGIGKNLHATLQMRNGSTMDVSSGDILPNGMKVVSIRSNEVMVETAKTRRLRLATGAPAATVHPQVAQRPMTLSMPPLPPMLPIPASPAGKGLSK